MKPIDETDIGRCFVIFHPYNENEIRLTLEILILSVLLLSTPIMEIKYALLKKFILLWKFPCAAQWLCRPLDWGVGIEGLLV